MVEIALYILGMFVCELVFMHEIFIENSSYHAHAKYTHIYDNHQSFCNIFCC